MIPVRRCDVRPDGGRHHDGRHTRGCPGHLHGWITHGWISTAGPLTLALSWPLTRARSRLCSLVPLLKSRWSVGSPVKSTNELCSSEGTFAAPEVLLKLFAAAQAQEAEHLPPNA